MGAIQMVDRECTKGERMALICNSCNKWLPIGAWLTNKKLCDPCREEQDARREEVSRAYELAWKIRQQLVITAGDADDAVETAWRLFACASDLAAEYDLAAIDAAEYVSGRISDIRTSVVDDNGVAIDTDEDIDYARDSLRATSFSAALAAEAAARSQVLEDSVVRTALDNGTNEEHICERIAIIKSLALEKARARAKIAEGKSINVVTLDELRSIAYAERNGILLEVELNNALVRESGMLGVASALDLTAEHVKAAESRAKSAIEEHRRMLLAGGSVCADLRRQELSIRTALLILKYAGSIAHFRVLDGIDEAAYTEPVCDANWERSHAEVLWKRTGLHVIVNECDKNLMKLISIREQLANEGGGNGGASAGRTAEEVVEKIRLVEQRQHVASKELHAVIREIKESRQDARLHGCA